MAFPFIPPPLPFQTHQHITVHQIHNPPLEILHPPFTPIFHAPPLTPVFNTIPYTPTPSPYIPPVPHPRTTAMHLFAPSALAEALSRAPHRLAHIVTYSSARAAAGDDAAVQAAVLATGLMPLITFDVGHFPAPPGDVCAAWSGTSAEVQEVVRGCGEGMRDLDEVVRLLMNAYDQGAGALLLLVACPGGTHRSVAVAEIIGKKLRRRGVTSVHVNHVHRVRRQGDAV